MFGRKRNGEPHPALDVGRLRLAGISFEPPLVVSVAVDSVAAILASEARAT